MGLNPFAQEFRPGALVALVNKPHLAAQPAPSHTITPEAIEIDATAVCKLEELPDEVRPCCCMRTVVTSWDASFPPAAAHP